MRAGDADALVKRPLNTEQAEVNLNGARILLVEDGETNRKFISLVLERVGACVTTAENGKVGLDAIEFQKQPYDIVLMDMQMPVMDGYTAARKLKEMNYPSPIVALTAHAMKGDDKACLEAGCTGYLTKPIDANVLVCKLGALMDTNSGIQNFSQEPQSTWKPRGNAAQPTQRMETYYKKNSEQSLDAETIVSSLPADDMLFQEIVKEFVEKLEVKLDLMSNALERRNFQEVSDLAHWLKGSGGTAGFPQFFDDAVKMEVAADDNNPEACHELMNSMKTTFTRIEVRTIQQLDA